MCYVVFCIHWNAFHYEYIFRLRLSFLSILLSSILHNFFIYEYPILSNRGMHVLHRTCTTTDLYSVMKVVSGTTRSNFAPLSRTDLYRSNLFSLRLGNCNNININFAAVAEPVFVIHREYYTSPYVIQRCILLANGESLESAVVPSLGSAFRYVMVESLLPKWSSWATFIVF